jgi:hypothetical protein
MHTPAPPNKSPSSVSCLLLAALLRLCDERSERVLCAGGVRLGEERVLQQLSHRRAPPGLLLEAPRHEVPELVRRSGWRLRRLAEAYGAHERGPVRALALGQEREVAQAQLQDGHPEAPHVGGVGVVVARVRLRVEPLGGHVRRRADVGRAGVQPPAQHLARAEVGDLHLAVGADEQVRRLEVAVNDAERVERREPEERLPRHGGDGALPHRPAQPAKQAREGAPGHELQRQSRGRLPGGGRRDHRVEAHDVGRVRGEHEDLGLARRGGVPVREDLECERLRGPAVPRLVDGAAVAVAENGEPFVVREAGVGRGGGRRGGGLRLRRQAQDEVVEREGKVRQLAALADDSHWLVGLGDSCAWGESWVKRGGKTLPREGASLYNGRE